MKKWFLQKKRVITTVGLLLILCGGVLLFVIFLERGDTTDRSSPHELATRMVGVCEDAEYRPFCYEQEVPSLLAAHDISVVFETIRRIGEMDNEYRFCHVLAHELGKRMVANDPQNWIDVIAKGPSDGLCSNGFVHGAVVARFSKEVLSDEDVQYALPELAIACEEREGWQPTPLDQAICYHGIGHVLVHMTAGNLAKGLEICDEIAKKEDGRDFTVLCHEGVFMQIFQPLEPEDFALVDMLDVPPTKESLKSFCDFYARDIQEFGACWREAWPLYFDTLDTASGILAFCSVLENESQRDSCMVTTITIKGRHGINNQAKQASLCNAFGTEFSSLCFNRSALAYIEEDRLNLEEATAFCAKADNPETTEGCYAFLLSSVPFVYGDNPAMSEYVCNTIPREAESNHPICDTM